MAIERGEKNASSDERVTSFEPPVCLAETAGALAPAAELDLI